MIKPKVGFIVYGVHKDGLLDPMDTPFIDDALVAASKKALADAGVELVEHDLILATKAEARECFARFKKMDDVDAVVLFSGTWVWAAHMIAAVRDFCATGKAVILWTHPASPGCRGGSRAPPPCPWRRSRARRRPGGPPRPRCRRKARRRRDRPFS